MVEQLSGDLRDARAEIQRYPDEVNRLKGERGQPTLRFTHYVFLFFCILFFPPPGI
jgi:hypothetical protein